MIQFEGEPSFDVGIKNVKRIEEVKSGDLKSPPLKVKVLGVGGAGCNIISRIFPHSFGNVEFAACDSSIKALSLCEGMKRFLVGESVTRGWGTGGDKEVARRIIQEAESDIKEFLDNTNLLFVVCSLSKGLGAGASPAIFKIAKEKGVLSVGFFVLPFEFEGEECVENSKKVLEELWHLVDGAVIVSNDALLNYSKEESGSSFSLDEAFAKIDEILEIFLQSVEVILYRPGLISVDFADLKSFLTKGKQIMITKGRGSGERCVEEAMEEIFYSPFWGEIPFRKVKGILLNIFAGKDFKVNQLKKIILSLREKAGYSIPINFGVYLERESSDDLTLTLISSVAKEPGFKGDKEPFRKELESGRYDQHDLDVPTFLRKKLT